jgi:hypothetical protein
MTFVHAGHTPIAVGPVWVLPLTLAVWATLGLEFNDTPRPFAKGRGVGGDDHTKLLARRKLVIRGSGTDVTQSRMAVTLHPWLYWARGCQFL